MLQGSKTVVFFLPSFTVQDVFETANILAEWKNDSPHTLLHSGVFFFFLSKRPESQLDAENCFSRKANLHF